MKRETAQWLDTSKRTGEHIVIWNGNYEESRNMENCFKLKIWPAKWYVPYHRKYVRSIWTKDDCKMQKWRIIRMARSQRIEVVMRRPLKMSLMLKHSCLFKKILFQGSFQIYHEPKWRFTSIWESHTYLLDITVPKENITATSNCNASYQEMPASPHFSSETDRWLERHILSAS